MKIKAGLSAGLVAVTLGAVCFTHAAAQRPLDPVPAVSDATLERPADGDWLTGTSLVSSGVSRLAREQAPSTANTLFAFALP